MKSLREYYAHALLGSCSESMWTQLRALSEVLGREIAFFSDEDIPLSQREQVLHQALDGRVETAAELFLLRLLRDRRIGELPAIVKCFEKLGDMRPDRPIVHLRIPFEPDEQLLEKLRAHLTESGLIPAESADRAEIEVIIDETLVGGFSAECAGQMLDTSIKSRMTALRRYAKAEYPTGKA